MLNSFKIIGKMEGVSLLLLLFIAVPLKHLWGHPEMVRIIGTLHGLLFLAYVVAATNLSNQLKWPNKTLVTAYVFSCLPFGTFVFEKKHLQS